MWKKIKTAARKAWLGVVGAALAVLGALGLYTSADAQAVPVVDTLTWTAPTQYVDGSAIPAGTITGYRIVWGATPEGVWPAANTLDVGPVLTRVLTRPETYGNRCYKLAALVGEVNGEWTAAACKNVQAPARAPGNVRVE